MAYLGRVEEAERLLLSIDRSDLAMQLRHRFGDWFRLAQLARDSAAGALVMRDKELAELHKAIGFHFADRMQW
ncbi:unnamed protein product [Protopolystoma xenopodis]|uniref:Uncharacterized protein n=1 Tax=Protopolystoma xenopodis TaxID=117903 RepID=A0A3S5B3J9_9PLAT|nr:unnamed protein product [Protopolystoma xenopodis]